MSGGFTFKRCPCAPVTNEAGKVLACKRKHGSWYFAAEVRDALGKRRQVRRGGYATQVDAQAALVEFAQSVNAGGWTDDRSQTVDEYLRDWPAVILYGGKRSLEGQIVVGTLDTIATQLGGSGFGQA